MTNSNFWVLENFGFCRLWFWVCCGCQKPFWATLSNSLKSLEDFPYLDHFCTGWTRWDILTWNLAENGHLGLLGWNRRKKPVFECPTKKSQNSIPKQMVQDRYYDGLKAYMGTFHCPERGPVYAPTRHTRSRNVENFGSKFGPLWAVTEISGHLYACWVHILGCGPCQNWVPI